MVVDLASINNDHVLALLFAEMPAQCIVLIEDIDAVGLKRKSAGGGAAADKDNDSDNNKGKEAKDEENPAEKTSNCTLSGLLNVLDGVVAQQWRIVLMTTNREAELDEALTRPGRIDKKIYLGNIGPEAAREEKAKKKNKKPLEAAVEVEKEKKTAENDKDGESTTKESENTEDAAAKNDDKNYSSKDNSDIGEVMLTSTEASSGDQSDNPGSKDSPVEPEKNG